MDDNSCTKIPFGIIQVFFYVTLVIIITIIINYINLKEYWKSNWEKSRCSLFALPFSSLVKPEISVTDNFKYCLHKETEPMIKAYTKYKLDWKARSAIQDEQNINNSLLTTHTNVEKSEKKVKSYFDKLKEIYKRFLTIGEYGVHKIRNFFLKIGAIVWTIYFLVITSANTVILQIAHFARTLTLINTFMLYYSVKLTLMMPPLGILLSAIIISANLSEKAAKKRAYCCFSKNTLVVKNNRLLCPIEFIKLGEKLLGNTTVTGIIDYDCPNTQMIEISNTIKVTADHLLLDKNSGKWIFSDELKLPDKTENNVMCFVTDNNIIPCNDYIFRDYEETSNNLLQSYFAKIILEKLGNKDCEIISKYELGEKNNCLSKNVLVKMKNDSFVEIDKIKKGDQLSSGEVLGIYKCITKNIEWYNINNNIISPRVICKINNSNNSNNNQWVKTYHVGKKIYTKKIFGYHLITSSGYFELQNNIIVRDFIEIKDLAIENEISSKITNFLNNPFNDVENIFI